MKPSSTENHQWFYRTFADQLARVVEMMTGEAPLVESTDSDRPRLDHHTIFESSLNLIPGGTLVAAAPASTWKKIGERILAVAGLIDQEDSELCNTFKEAVDQAFSGLAHAVSTRLSRGVEAVSSKIVPDLQREFVWANIEIVLAEDLSVPLLIGISDTLLNAFDLQDSAGGPVAAVTSLDYIGDGVAGVGASAGNPPKSVEIILDVELPVCVSFGRAQLLLKDVLKLNTGSIIELNRSVNEPVEIVVNGTVVAKGEVVVVEGNFGVRIQSVISRQERIRSLH